MGKKYTFTDVSDPKLPHITQGRFIHGHGFTHKCQGRGSLGYGHSAAHAYDRWFKNWQRRYAFYAQREQHVAVCLATHREAKAAAKVKQPGCIVCNRCQTGNLHWVDTDLGFRLFDADEMKHHCS